MSSDTGSVRKRLGWLPLRLTVALFCWSTALYACLASSAFTYRQFIRGPLFPWVGTFAAWHAPASFAVLLMALVSLAGAFKQPGPARLLSIWFAGVWTAICVALAVHPILPGLKDDLVSIAVVVVALAPLVWLGVIDHLRAAAHRRWAVDELTPSQMDATEQHMLSAAIVAAAFATIVYAMLTPVFAAGAFEPDLLTLGLATGLFASAVDHLVIFCGAVFLIVLVERATHAIGSFHVRYTIEIALLTVACSFVIQQTMGQAVGLSGASGLLVVAALAASVIATWAGLSIVGRMDERVRPSSALDVLCGSPNPGRQGGRRLAALAVITAVAVACAVGLPVIDWDFVLLKSSVTIVWVAIFAQVYRALPRARSLSAAATVAMALTPLVVHGVQTRGIDAAVRRLADPQFSFRRTLNRYLVYNPSFRLADGLLDGGTASQPDFGRFLRANTGLGIDVRPVDLSLAPNDQPSPLATKPFIFLFIIDTLRPDYLSPYNGSVRFTPRVARFADESVVFRNAFTRYGGTGLSVPAIWMGAASVHKQYVQPFYPVNTLEKLLDVNGYQRFLSLDIVMQPLLRPSPATNELDRGLLTRELRLCHTLDELGRRLPQTPDGPPMFVYSLPQDLHSASLIGAGTPAGESYPGFNEPYAARVHAIDTCFGAFIDLLKERRIYDRSVIVLTSDHGELLGEDRRWGHAYYLFPEVLQIPLIIHFPRGVLEHHAIDPRAVALTTDITPTLYATLGYRPRRETPLVGQSLIAQTVEEIARRRGETYVFAASYGAVYAVLRQNGRRLYIVDAVKDQEYAYERQALGRWIPIEVTAGLRAVNQRAIREYIDEISRVYHVTIGP